MGGMIDIDEIERRIPSRATECAYCHRLATLACPVCGVLVCEDHRAIHVRETTGTACEGVEMIPAHHDAVTMDRVALVAEVRRLRAELDRMAAARDNAVDLWNRSLDDARRIETQRDEARRIAESRYQDLVDFDGRFRQREASIVSEARRWKVKAVEQSAEVRRLRAALVEVVQHEKSNGHCHARRAVWDADNHEGLRGERCERCHTFADARSAIGLPRWDVVRPSSHDEPMTAPCPADCGCAAPRYATHADAPPPWPEWARQFQMERDDARAENERLRAELATARSTIDGSPDEPTDAELSAHAGAWLARLYNGAYATMTETAARNARGVMMRRGPYAARWWALDQNERFCLRPVVTTVAATLDAGPRDADGREVTT